MTLSKGFRRNSSTRSSQCVHAPLVTASLQCTHNCFPSCSDLLRYALMCSRKQETTEICSPSTPHEHLRCFTPIISARQRRLANGELPSPLVLVDRFPLDLDPWHRPSLSALIEIIPPVFVVSRASAASLFSLATSVQCCLPSKPSIMPFSRVVGIQQWFERVRR